MPRDYKDTSSFVVLDTSEKTTFLFMRDDKYNSQVGNLFISDGLGYRFSHSLNQIWKGQYGGDVEFEAIESMDGTFIANRYDRSHTIEMHSHTGKLATLSEDDIHDI